MSKHPQTPKRLLRMLMPKCFAILLTITLLAQSAAIGVGALVDTLSVHTQKEIVSSVSPSGIAKLDSNCEVLLDLVAKLSSDYDPLDVLPEADGDKDGFDFGF